MRHLAYFVLLACLALAWQPVAAQQAADKRVEKIREAYADVKKSSAYKKEAGLPPDEMVIDNQYMAPGAGPINETYHYFYGQNFDEDVADIFYDLQFVTHKYNIGASQYYEEALYDDDGQLAFYFIQGPEGEFRYYFDKDQVILRLATGPDPRDEYDADLLMLRRHCTYLSDAFNALMNQSME